MSLLLLELSCVCYICFRKVKTSDVSPSAFFPLIITNLGVTNIGIIGANEFIRKESKDSGINASHCIKETNRFIKISAVTSFLHHTFILTSILVLTIMNPMYFQHWAWKSFILNTYGGYFFQHRYVVFYELIGSGFIGLLSSLIFGARGLKILL